MIIDVSITYDGRNITARSETAGHSETRLATIGLSKERFGEVECIECIGEVLIPQMQQDFWNRDKGSRVYRFINPFLIESFEPDFAFAIVQYFCYQAHGSIKPARNLWRHVIKLDHFIISLKLPQYSRIPAEKRKAFEKKLKRQFGRFEIEE